MAINFPTSLDTLSNPTAGDLLENATTALDHDQQHANANDAIEALEAKVGINSSAVTTSHDYKLGEVTGTDKAVGKTATQTLTNKTLTSPVINLGSNATGDIYYRDSGGAFQRLAIGTSGQVLAVSTGGIPTWQTGVGVGTAVSCIGKPVGGEAATTIGTLTVNVNTTMTLGLVYIPYNITVNSITIEASAVAVAGTLDLTVYSEDGQTQKIAVTTATISGAGNVTTAVSAVALTPGNYYVGINPNGTADVTVRSYSIANLVLFHTVSGEPMYAGTETITAGTPDATITPTGLTATASNFAVFRFDN